MQNLTLDGNSLTLDDLYRCASSPSKLSFSAAAKRRMTASRRVVEGWIKRGETVYGVTTGFGEFSNVRIDDEHLEELQENLIVSHAAGTGEPLPDRVVRAMMILRMNALVKGYSGIRPATMEFFRKVFNAGVVPIVPSRGSVGSSGDLAPLAHLVLSLLGKGKVVYDGAIMDSAVALKRIGLKPWKLGAKEGLALVNGTQMMTALGALALHEALELARHADIAAAMAVDALKGSDTAFDERIHRVRPHAGQILCAANLRKLIAGSEIRESHRYNDARVQDAYSIRCIPQVHGASRDAMAYVEEVLRVELNSANDNPLIFADSGDHLEGGNFHGQPIALALDFLGIALAELANISERRIERMVNGSLSGLPRFLIERGGLHSGLMIAQYTAASLVSENKVLAHPASVDSIPTSANQEDHNSMGSISAHKLWQILHNVQTVIAIELLVGAQALDFSARDARAGRAMKPGKGIAAAHRVIRRRIPHLDADRILHDDIQAALTLLRSGAVLRAVEQAAGALN
jgi:histidine ammonia-lyase